MTRLLIGVPARNEAERIVELADRIERGASLLPSDDECHLALAYQQSDDDTLERFTSRKATLPRVVLHSPGLVGKGANVKLLLQRALDDGVDFLLLVDADLGDYDPRNLVRVVDAARGEDFDLVLRSGAGHMVRATRRTTSPARCCSRPPHAIGNRSPVTCCCDAD